MSGDPSTNPAEHTWHALPVQDALTALGTRAEGLNETEVRERLALYGPNRLPPAAGRSALLRLLLQFHNLLI